MDTSLNVFVHAFLSPAGACSVIMWNMFSHLCGANAFNKAVWAAGCWEGRKGKGRQRQSGK